MADLNIMPLYTDAYLADTTHLTTEEHGAYLLILLAMWRAGSALPNDPDLLRRIAKATANRWAKIWPSLAGFFEVADGSISQKKLIHEFKRAAFKRSINSKNGSEGGKATALNYKSVDVANATDSLDDRHSETHSENVAGLCHTVNRKPVEEKHIRAVAARHAPAKPLRFEEFWIEYPRRDGANPKAPAKKVYEAAVRSGADEQAVIDGAKRYRADMRRRGQDGSQYVAQAVTWLRQSRWVDEQLALAPPASTINWDSVLRAYTGDNPGRRGSWVWPGTEPGNPGCVVPPEIQRKHGFEPAVERVA